MGLFDKLFEKKNCAICGAEIGLMGNRKLEDGNMCKDCAAKLSPWFKERKQSTVAEIEEQLEYRERNREAAARFHVTRTIGSDNTKILFDEDARKFVVTSARNLEEANPDVMDFSMVTGCNLDVRDRRNEEKKHDKEKGFVSYNPPRYRQYYDFFITIHVNHTYFDEMEFKINSYSLETTPTTGAPLFRIPDPETVAEYRDYVQMGEEIIAILSEVREQARAEAAPKAAVKCPYCGATTVPDVNGCCEFCGGAV